MTKVLSATGLCFAIMMLVSCEMAPQINIERQMGVYGPYIIITSRDEKPFEIQSVLYNEGSCSAEGVSKSELGLFPLASTASFRLLKPASIAECSGLENVMKIRTIFVEFKSGLKMCAYQPILQFGEQLELIGQSGCNIIRVQVTTNRGNKSFDFTK